MKLLVRIIFRWGLILSLFIFSFVILTNIWMIRSTAALIFNDVNDLPPNRVALVLGTSPKLMDGSANPFFEQRIAAAADLYQQEKIRHIIVSGDNRTRYYNEPYEMQKALISKGVPRKAITLDYAGLRTLDSVVRSKEIFDQDEIIIITQPFHAYRALFISRSNGLDAVAFSIEEPAISSTLRVRFREYMARSWAVLDVYIFKTSPRYLGDKEPIG